MVSLKKAESKVESIWKIKDISDLEVNLVVQEGGEDGSDTKAIDIRSFLKDWKLNKSKQTYKVTGWSSSKCTPMQSVAWLLDGAKGAAALAMQSVWKDHSDLLKHVEIFAAPSSVQVTRDFKVGDLKLVGASQRIDRTEPSKGVYFKLCEVQLPDSAQCSLFLSSHFTAPTNAKGEQVKSPWVAPFWWVVASSTDKERAEAELGDGKSKAPQANMILRYVPVTMVDLVVQVPVLLNSTALKAGTTLHWNTKQSKEPTAKRQKKH